MKKMRMFFLLFCAAVYAGAAWAQQSAREPYQDSFAYRQYKLRPPSELSKLLYLMDRYRDSDFKVIFDGAEYDSRQALGYAKSYLARNYKKQKAAPWLKQHAYRSPSGKVIYLKSPAGETVVLRDALLHELELIAQS